MARPVTLFTGQWADIPLEDLLPMVKDFGFDGVELACWGDHIEPSRATVAYCRAKKRQLKEHGLKLFAISNHLVGQAVCDRIDERHQGILPDHVWGDGDPEGVRQRAAEEMVLTARTAKRLGCKVVNGFTGSSIWHLLYSFPPVPESMIEAGFKDFAKRWRRILNEFKKLDVKFALEVHPTEIAFDIASAERALKALRNHKSFGFNYDPSHLGYQGVDYIEFLRRFKDRIFHVHIKDVWWSDTPKAAGVFGGHTSFGNSDRFWDFRSPGRGSIDFEEIIRTLNDIGYDGPLSIEWEDSGMDRCHGAEEACAFTRAIDFEPSKIAFDAAFED